MSPSFKRVTRRWTEESETLERDLARCVAPRYDDTNLDFSAVVDRVDEVSGGPPSGPIRVVDHVSAGSGSISRRVGPLSSDEPVAWTDSLGTTASRVDERIDFFDWGRL
jgi:hypothetical protein